MKKFKNVFLLAAMAVSAVSVASCSKDDEPAAAAAFEIKEVVDGGDAYNDKIDAVKVIVGDETLATGTYANGGFTIVLPASVPDKHLQVPSGAPSGTPKYLLIDSRNFHPYKQNELVVGVSFRYYETGFIYAEGDLPLPSGGGSVKKGWNKVYTPNGGAMTTTPPSPAPKWSVYGN